MTVEEQYKQLPRLRDVPKVPVLRPDAKYAGDYKPAPDKPLAVIKVNDVEVGGNMAIVDSHVHVLPVLVKQKSEG